MRRLIVDSGRVGVASGEVASSVRSWSMNCPTNVIPAVCVGWSRFEPGLTMRFSGPEARSSRTSIGPPGAPSAFSAAITFGDGSANGLRSNRRPKRSGRTIVWTSGACSCSRAAALARPGVASIAPAAVAPAAPNSRLRLIGQPDSNDISLPDGGDTGRGRHYGRLEIAVKFRWEEGADRNRNR